MVIWGMMEWWYTDGWRQCFDRAKGRLLSTLDFFSIDLLAKTLFAPFRQIAAGKVGGPLEVQLRAFFDRLFSRVIGMFVRLIMIGIGSVTIVIDIVVGGVLLLMWPLVPLLPIVGMFLFMMGWVPWSS